MLNSQREMNNNLKEINGNFKEINNNFKQMNYDITLILCYLFQESENTREIINLLKKKLIRLTNNSNKKQGNNSVQNKNQNQKIFPYF